MNKIDEMYSRINELAAMKMNLEIQNKKLRDENHELASTFNHTRTPFLYLQRMYFSFKYSQM